MDAVFRLLVLAWIWLTFLKMCKPLAGLKYKLEKLEKAGWIVTIVTGIFLSLDTLAKYLPPIRIPQTNATTSEYITIRVPRLFPGLPYPIFWVIVGVFVVTLIASTALTFYFDVIRKKPVAIVVNIQRRTLGFNIESTADWFEVGIKDSKIYGSVRPEKVKGWYQFESRIDRLYVYQGENRMLMGIFKVIFDMVSSTLFIRKGDVGHVKLGVFHVRKDGSHSPIMDLGTLVRTHKPSNEQEYTLPDLLFEQE